MIAFLKVFGANGHRQRESFNESHRFVDWRGATITTYNSNITGTNDYTLLTVEAPNDNICKQTIDGQISDGIFENCRIGEVQAITEAEFLQLWQKQKLYIEEDGDILTESELVGIYNENGDKENFPTFIDWLDTCINYACTLEKLEYKGDFK